MGGRRRGGREKERGARGGEDEGEKKEETAEEGRGEDRKANAARENWERLSEITGLVWTLENRA